MRSIDIARLGSIATQRTDSGLARSARWLMTPILMATLALAPVAWAATNQNLPELGDSTSAIVSPQQERQLGQAFLRSLRAQAPLLKDPLMQEYLEHLIYQLAANSQLQDRRLELVLINDSSLNAFAAPGGIVGVNVGLFLYAETQHEISAILAHELAHLSQRHFARGIEAGRSAGLKNIAGLLAGIVLATTTGSDAGMAAITAGRGAALDQQLRYSRSREAEADRVGIFTLADADMDPRAMAYMFERLDRANRFNSSRVPEFLLTHPVTQDRIADSYNQTRSYPRRVWPLDLDYQLMRNRARVLAGEANTSLLTEFDTQIQQPDPITQAAGRYGRVLTLARLSRTDEATSELRSLLETYPGKLAFILAEAELYARSQQLDKATEILRDALKINPRNYSLSMAYADVLLQAESPELAASTLSNLAKDRPTDVNVWYLLAEANGLANDIVGVHEARAEYFVLVGNFDQAITQLGYALPLARDNFGLRARIQQRIENIHEMRREPARL